MVEQNDLINNALAGTFEALEWRQFGAVDPDLNYIFWSTTTIFSSRSPSTWPATRTRNSQAALELGRTSSNAAMRAKAYQTVNKRLAIDLPYLWLTEPYGRSSARPRSRTGTTPQRRPGQPPMG